jgi:hypothetical protein
VVGVQGMLYAIGIMYPIPIPPSFKLEQDIIQQITSISNGDPLSLQDEINQLWVKLSPEEQIMALDYKIKIGQEKFTSEDFSNIIKIRGGEINNWRLFEYIVLIIAIRYNLNKYQDVEAFINNHWGNVHGKTPPKNENFKWDSKTFNRDPKNHMRLQNSQKTDQHSGNWNISTGSEEISITPKRLDHFVSKHGHDFGVHDILHHTPGDGKSAYPQTRTRLNQANRALFHSNLQRFCAEREPLSGITIRGVEGGKAWFCASTRVAVAILKDSETGEWTLANAHKLSPKQATNLIVNKRI